MRLLIAGKQIVADQQYSNQQNNLLVKLKL